MTTEEKIKQAAREYTARQGDILSEKVANSFIAGANFGREIGMREAFEWISTKNNLPEENLRVLVKLKGGKTDVASLISFPDKNHEDGKRMYWRISTSTMYWFDEVEYFRYINLENYTFLDGSPCGKEVEG